MVGALFWRGAKSHVIVVIVGGGGGSGICHGGGGGGVCHDVGVVCALHGYNDMVVVVW